MMSAVPKKQTNPELFSNLSRIQQQLQISPLLACLPHCSVEVVFFSLSMYRTIWTFFKLFDSFLARSYSFALSRTIVFSSDYFHVGLSEAGK